MPRGPDMTLYRRAQWGKLVDFSVLDTRQYRTDQPNGDGAKPLNEAALAPENTMLGAKQRAWLEGALADSRGVWTLIAQQVMMGMVAHAGKDDAITYRMDQWSGYASERMKLVKFMQDRRTPNPIVITGDVHSNWANDLRVDDRDPRAPVVAAEFVGTSISSGGKGTETPSTTPRLMRDNAGVRWHNAERGYVLCTATPQTWRADYVVVDDVLRDDSPCRVRASFAVEAGRPGVVRS
jgi:alkaline phosphatase D